MGENEFFSTDQPVLVPLLVGSFLRADIRFNLPWLHNGVRSIAPD